VFREQPSTSAMPRWLTPSARSRRICLQPAIEGDSLRHVRIPATRTRRTVPPASQSSSAAAHPATENRLTLHRHAGSLTAERRSSPSAICTCRGRQGLD
jgi:hypothetical protein